MNYEEKRNDLVDKLVRRGYVKSDLVEKSMRKVPRHLFVPKDMKK
ncbi:MAG: protein-L-isoaspartate O-methyltransferase, partial [Thermoplasmatota archaeon]